MKCPACGTNELRVHKTWLGPKVNRRQQRCCCGIAWTLIERIEPGTIYMWSAEGEIRGEIAPEHRYSVAKATVNECDPLSSSDLGISSLPLSSDLNSSSSLLGKPRARRGRPTTGEYSPEFIAFWDALPVHRGNKGKAFKAWVKFEGEILADPNLVLERYKMRAQTADWLRGFNQHVSTWLNERGWDTVPDPSEYELRGSDNGVPQRIQDSRDTARRWMERKKAVG